MSHTRLEKLILAKRQALRIRIETAKVTRDKLNDGVMGFNTTAKDNLKRHNRYIHRLERQLANLEEIKIND